MTRVRSLLRVALVLFLAAAVPAACADVVQDIVDQVSQGQYTSYLSDLNFLYTHAGDNRGRDSAQHDAARANVQSRLAGFGLTTTLDAFTFSSKTYYNVVAEQTGALHPEQIYVIGAHYDSVGNPGADDNASGVAGVLEAARVLSQYRLECTVRYIAFDCEESGLVGSGVYAAAASARGDNIVGMISLDMIAYNHNNGFRADLYARPASDPVKNALAAALAAYGGLSYDLNGPYDASDHAPFEWNNYRACLLIEEWGPNPYYHAANDNVDTPGYIDYLFATRMTKGVVAYLVQSADVMVPEPGTGLLVLAVFVVIRRRSA